MLREMSLRVFWILVVALVAAFSINATPTKMAYAQVSASSSASVSGSPGTVLYRADWSNGMNGWTTAASGWKVNRGILLNDGTAIPYYDPYEPSGPTIVAPYKVPVADYAVEVRMQVLEYRVDTLYSEYSIGLTGRGSEGVVEWNGYAAGAELFMEKMDAGPATVYLSRQSTFDQWKSSSTSIGGSWHTYRMEFRGNDIKFLLDGRLIAEGVDNSYLSGKQVGLFCFGTQIQVSSFVVYTV